MKRFLGIAIAFLCAGVGCSVSSLSGPCTSDMQCLGKDPLHPACDLMNDSLKGACVQCTATNTWTLYYTPYTYPHPLVSGSSPPPPPPPPPPSVPTITSANTATATVGSAFSYQITATNSPTATAA